MRGLGRWEIDHAAPEGACAYRYRHESVDRGSPPDYSPCIRHKGHFGEHRWLQGPALRGMLQKIKQRS